MTDVETLPSVIVVGIARVERMVEKIVLVMNLVSVKVEVTL